MHHHAYDSSFSSDRREAYGMPRSYGRPRSRSSRRYDDDMSYRDGNYRYGRHDESPRNSYDLGYHTRSTPRTTWPGDARQDDPREPRPRHAEPYVRDDSYRRSPPSRYHNDYRRRSPPANYVDSRPGRSYYHSYHRRSPPTDDYHQSSSWYRDEGPPRYLNSGHDHRRHGPQHLTPASYGDSQEHRDGRSRSPRTRGTDIGTSLDRSERKNAPKNGRPGTDRREALRAGATPTTAGERKWQASHVIPLQESKEKVESSIATRPGRQTDLKTSQKESPGVMATESSRVRKEGTEAAPIVDASITIASKSEGHLRGSQKKSADARSAASRTDRENVPVSGRGSDGALKPTETPLSREVEGEVPRSRLTKGISDSIQKYQHVESHGDNTSDDCEDGDDSSDDREEKEQAWMTSLLCIEDDDMAVDELETEHHEDDVPVGDGVPTYDDDSLYADAQDDRFEELSNNSGDQTLEMVDLTQEGTTPRPSTKADNKVLALRMRYQEEIARLENETVSNRFAGPLAKIMIHYLTEGVSNPQTGNDVDDLWDRVCSLEGLEYKMTVEQWYSLSLPKPEDRMRADKIRDFWFDDYLINDLVSLAKGTYAADAYFLDSSLLVRWLAGDRDSEYLLQQIERDIALFKEDRTSSKVDKILKVLPKVPDRTMRMILPICNDGHWFVAMLEPAVAKITIYDSLMDKSCFNKARKVLPVFAELLSHNTTVYMPKKWTFEQGICSKQVNGYDCGAYTAWHCRLLMQKADIEVVFGVESDILGNNLRYQYLEELYPRLFSGVRIEDDPDLRTTASKLPKGGFVNGQGVTSHATTQNPSQSHANAIQLNNQRYDARNAADERAIEKLYDLAEKQVWLGLPKPTATVLTRILDRDFGGRNGNITAVKKLASPSDDLHVHLQRKEIPTMLDGRWYGDSIVSAIVSSQFLQNSITDTQVADPEEVDRLLNCTDEMLRTNELGIMFTMSREVRRILSIINVDNMHYVAFEADKNTYCIRIWDSWEQDDPEDQDRFCASVEGRMLRLFNTTCSNEAIDDSWSVTAGQWRLGQARNNQVPLTIDVPTSRYRNAVRIDALLAGTLAWGQPDPFAAELIQGEDETNTNPPKTIHNFGPNLRIGMQMMQKIDDALEAAKIAKIHGPIDVIDAMPEFETAISYRDATKAIVDDRPEENLTTNDVCDKYEVFYKHLYPDRPLAQGWRGKLLRAIRARTTVLHVDPSTDVVKMGIGAEAPTKAALAFYGKGMDEVLMRTSGMTDDIDYRSDITIVVIRHSGIDKSLETRPGHWNIHDTMDEIAEKNLEYYWTVHGGTPDKPRRVADVDDPDLSEPKNLAWFYKIIRSSCAPALKGNNGSADGNDDDLIKILDKMDNFGEDRDVKTKVTFLVAGIDGWTTDADSLRDLVDGFPNIDFRLTMVMPIDRTVRLSHVFKARGPFSWAHFKLDLVFEIAARMSEDRSSLLPWQFPDQYGLTFVLERANITKLARHDVSISQMPEDSHGETIGHEITTGVYRHSFNFPADVKECCNCGSETTNIAWHRGPDNEADVLCDATACLGDAEFIGRKDPPTESGTATQQGISTGRATRKRKADQEDDNDQLGVSAVDTQNNTMNKKDGKVKRSYKRPVSKNGPVKLRKTCTSCYLWKIRCDGGHPNTCTNCADRGLQCVYHPVGTMDSKRDENGVPR
ncbi:hypothetical protein M409DRAFT_48582 [Zasmidium cellare ATCC 36951]|uniref:Zn(2)-C6 fungal-type domain-containing protein n=1 Tax=Zasmidium cellare ATCC 36951 TaxID=1080233 RepID=A0A6A6D3K6_ZASCE|nr:uncharacterized protein M409DRAFT_48582 [Zasmidium cellare ATCC 36951]KAF2173635.1 hypothetical protein M409DRAFT_48582 [Zasmidium cellare ATCC 36951]